MAQPQFSKHFMNTPCPIGVPYILSKLTPADRTGAIYILKFR